MQIKGRDSIGTYLSQSVASKLEHPADVLSFPKAGIPSPSAPAPTGTEDRIVDYLREHGRSSDAPTIVKDLGLSVSEGTAVIERLEHFGFVTVDRDDGRMVVALPA